LTDKLRQTFIALETASIQVITRCLPDNVKKVRLKILKP